MKPKRFDIDPIDVDTDGLAQAQAVAAAGNLTLNGALISGGVFTADHPRQISITSDGVDNGRTFTVTGTDPEGKAQTEAITGPNATTVESSKYWATVTQIAADDACAGNISSGTVDEIAHALIPIDFASDSACTVAVDVTGTINFTVRETFDTFQRETNASANQYFDIDTLTSQTADTVAAASVGATGIQVLVNSYSSGAEMQVYVSQPVGR